MSKTLNKTIRKKGLKKQHKILQKAWHCNKHNGKDLFLKK